jgi:hypothetical protein
MKAMRKCNDEIYQLSKDQALVKKLKKTKDLGLFVLPSGCNVCNSRIQKLSLFLSLIFFPTWIVVNDKKNLICPSHPTSAPATQSVDSRARASFS